MKRMSVLIVTLVVCPLLLLLVVNPVNAQGAVNYTFEHQDPAGDVQKYNATLNGTASDDFEGLDIKHLTSSKAGDDLIINLDLKAKEKFRLEDGTKYVFRILTSPDNSTGYNITFRNGTATMNSFTLEGNGTSVDMTAQVSFVEDKGDEAMEVRVSIPTYLGDITHYGLDAYSMKVTNNATYLDYISELPGHPEYVNPEVEEEEGLDDDYVDDDDDDDDVSTTTYVGFGICAVIAVILIVVAIIVVVIVMRRKRSKEPGEEKKTPNRPRPPPPPPED